MRSETVGPSRMGRIPTSAEGKALGRKEEAIGLRSEIRATVWNAQLGGKGAALV